MIYGAIKGQQLKVKAQAAADTIDYLIAKFTFLTADWEGLTKYAHFTKDQERYSVQLTDDEIKEEDHLNLTEGEWQIYLHGNEYRNGEVIKRVTTNIATFQVQPTGALNGEPFPETDPSVVEQLAAEIEAQGETIQAMAEEVDQKVDKEEGKGLSTEDYTTAEKQKLAQTEIYTSAEEAKLNTIETGAEVNKVIDVLDSDGNSVVGADRKARLPESGGGTITDVQDEDGNSLVSEGVATIPSEVVELLKEDGTLKYSINDIFFNMPNMVMYYRKQIVVAREITSTTPRYYRIYYIRRNNYSPYNYQLGYAEFNEDGTIRSQFNYAGRWTEAEFTDAEKTKLNYIESGAQVNVIEKIKTADGTELPVTNKTVTLPEAEEQIQSDWEQSDSTAKDYIKNKPAIPVVPTLATVATTGDYYDLIDKPDLSVYALSANLGAVATSNDYNDLDNKPTIVTPVQPDWNEGDSTALDFIKNKPTIPVQGTITSGSTGYATGGDVYTELQNIPSMPSGTNNGDILVWNGSAWVARQQGTLPAGYRQTQYIEFTGTEYVDTGVKISDLMDIRLDVSFTDLTAMGNNGVNEGDEQNLLMMNYRPGTPNLISFGYKSTYGDAFEKIGPAIDSTDTIYQVFVSMRDSAVYFGTTKYTPTYTMIQSLLGNLTYYIGAANSEGTPQLPSKEKVYILTFYNYRSERIADFVPCVREADNKAGLYDVVGEQFHAIQIIE